MNTLLGFGLGRHYCVMQEVGEGGGGAGGAGGSGDGGANGGAQGGDGGTGGAGGQGGGPEGNNGGSGGAGGEGGGKGVPKPYLGGEEGSSDQGKESQGGEGGDGKTAPASEADYLKAVVKDEALLGDDKSVQLDQGLVKAMIPKAQELGVSPEAFNKLANSFAKAQIDSAKDAVKKRMDYFGKMKDESMRKYTPSDFDQINAGIDHWFKPNGVMNNVIRNSELGADPEFLALMHFMGSKRVMDSVKGAAEGGGGSSVDPNSTEGLSKIW